MSIAVSSVTQYRYKCFEIQSKRVIGYKSSSYFEGYHSALTFIRGDLPSEDLDDSDLIMNLFDESFLASHLISNSDMADRREEVSLDLAWTVRSG